MTNNSVYISLFPLFNRARRCYNQSMGKVKIIALEGIDGSGKTVQFKALTEYLRSRGFKVCTKEYPVYEGFFGRTIGELLSGHGKLTANDVDPRSMAVWFALDRFSDLKELDYEDCDYLIVNRYVLSNMVYQSMRAPDDKGFTDWVYKLEHEVLGVPVPDAYVFFDITTQAAGENVKSKGYRDYVGSEKDVYERDNKMQTLWRECYLECARAYGNIISIDCMGTDGMLPPETISGQVLEKLAEMKLI